MTPHSAIYDKLTRDLEHRWAPLLNNGEKLRRERMEEDGDLASPTVAGVPSGLSPCGSQAKPLIDYREGKEVSNHGN